MKKRTFRNPGPNEKINATFTVRQQELATPELLALTLVQNN